MTMQTTRRCKDVLCDNPIKDISCFRPHRHTCIKCVARQTKEYKRKFPEKIKEAQRKYHQQYYWKNKHRLEVNKEYKKHPEKWWHRTINKLYKLTYNDYMEIFNKQLSRCAICKRHQNDSGRRLSVDHNHSCCPENTSCGKCIRGLLCDKCNHGLGNFNDNVDLLQKAIDYINNNRR